MAKRIPIETIIKVYEKKGCNVTATCDALGISRRTFYKWRESNKKLVEQLDAANEAIIDFAESKLIEHIQNNDVQALMFFLRTKGKARGYVEKVEQQVTLNPFIELMQSLPDDD
ncbi:MAG: phBC6A51 family helix-turn-helix protein [Clostridiales bacterium]|nr:phBC6A51 family helix-turn-helix protein [Clostridiales bacterium]MCM1576981.1 phBC6A51 family helix-turn-helix protein [Bacteroides sp.]